MEGQTAKKNRNFINTAKCSPMAKNEKGTTTRSRRNNNTSGDLQIQQFDNRSERVIIFVVDASGSAAVARLAEAKGAVELMLANAYSKRDFVALIGFRGQVAETLLEPTRSLVQAKRTCLLLQPGVVLLSIRFGKGS